MGKRLLPFFALAAAVLVMAGCSAEAVRSQAGRIVAQARLANDAAAIPDSPGNRVLVAGADGNLFLVAPDGSERFALTTDASNSRRYLQPTWAPDGQRIAWARLDGQRSFLDGYCLVAGYQPEFRVGSRGRPLDETERRDELAWQGHSAYRKIFDRTLGLRAPQRILRNLQFSHAVLLDSV